MSESDEINLWCWVLGDKPSRIFGVSIKRSATIDDLKSAIKGRKPSFKDIAADSIELFKFQLPLENFNEDCAQSIKFEDSRQLKSSKRISFYWMEDPGEEVLSVILPRPAGATMTPSPSNSFSTSASLKHPRSPSAQGDGEAKKKHTTSRPFARRWTINGAITEEEANGRYYVDPGTQNETSFCLNAVSEGTYLLLAGARASGKSTRLIWLRQKLEAMGYWALYISFESLLYRSSTELFWESFGKAIEFAVAGCGRGLPKGPTTPISSRADFMPYFRKDFWDGKVVLLLDEFSCLYQGEDDVRDDCLQAFRGLKHNRKSHAVQCLIAAGTSNIVYLNSSTAPPFNVTDFVQSPYFTIDETRKLFREFTEDLGLSIDDGIVEDVWAKSNGHPGMVCLCGRTISRNMQTLICPQSRTISYYRWERFPVERLYGEISLYNTFHCMIQSLFRAEASSSVNLLRSQFAGFLGDVTLTDEKAKKDADTLTSEGVLLKPDPAIACYRMASPLVDGLIRNQLIPARFTNAPLSPLPLQHTGNDVDVLGILVESLKFFDKALILSASSCSYKTPKVKIHGSHGGRVPRESVYDTELMRILANWLRKYGWSVNSQWHFEDHLKRHKYSDIVLKKDSLTIVLELLATGEPNSVESHIRKTPEHAALLSANEAWVVHFTRQEDYHPIWQSDMELSKSTNVVHFAHDPEFTNVVMSARWKDCTGKIQQVVGKSLLSLD